MSKNKLDNVNNIDNIKKILNNIENRILFNRESKFINSVKKYIKPFENDELKLIINGSFKDTLNKE